MNGNLISHNVFFELENFSAQSISNLVADCHKYLKPIEGIVYFAAGRIHKQHDRDVNIKDFDAAAHITFISQEAHDKYQKHPLHNEFVERNKKKLEVGKSF